MTDQQQSEDNCEYLIYSSSNEALLCKCCFFIVFDSVKPATVAGGVANIIRSRFEASGAIGKNGLTAKITATNTAGTKINLTTQ